VGLAVCVPKASGRFCILRSASRCQTSRRGGLHRAPADAAVLVLDLGFAVTSELCGEGRDVSLEHHACPQTRLDMGGRNTSLPTDPQQRAAIHCFSVQLPASERIFCLGGGKREGGVSAAG